jgi:hypothetical protein
MSDRIEILRTEHGSHLYGLAHSGSDHDEYVIYLESMKARQRVNKDEGTDTVRMGLPQFIERIEAGSHQSVEALFSPVKKVHPEWAAFFAGYRVTSPHAFAAYERTIKKFAHWGDVKRQRHAIRLALNLRDLRREGRFNSRLSPREVDMVLKFGATQADTFFAVEMITGLVLTPDEESARL